KSNEIKSGREIQTFGANFKFCNKFTSSPNISKMLELFSRRASSLYTLYSFSVSRAGLRKFGALGELPVVIRLYSLSSKLGGPLSLGALGGRPLRPCLRPVLSLGHWLAVELTGPSSTRTQVQTMLHKTVP